MNVYFIAFAFLYVISEFVALLQPPREDLPKPSATTAFDYAPTLDNSETNPDLKSLWLNRPPSIRQSQNDDEHPTHRVVSDSPYSLTRLAKPLSYGYDPFFRKQYFEPFERRQKPVTLVAFRKHGIIPRKSNVCVARDD
ncbi:uncharacterized protein LOC120636472 isoform X2 [Pararge aegeria]|uniref:uncharacterized protein LOC120636472 isoform X2 n=1 Tax=Pararge aegeria TaxID=116150 RepID=UPI0019D18761|nr:uncharacterized protein LOC120636472 isoform X2 [Pararge aegeria]